MTTKTKQKSPWMRGFVISPRKTETELLHTDSRMRSNDYKHKMIKRGR